MFSSFGDACGALTSDRKNQPVPLSEEQQDKVYAAVDSLLLACPHKTDFATRYLRKICTAAPRVSEIFLMYLEKFDYDTLEISRILQHVPEEALKEPRYSMSGNAVIGPGLLDVIPVAQRDVKGNITINIGWVGHTRGATPQEMKEKMQTSFPDKQNDVFLDFIDKSKEMLSKPNRFGLYKSVIFNPSPVV
jgi:hypothetical protein